MQRIHHSELKLEVVFFFEIVRRIKHELDSVVPSNPPKNAMSNWTSRGRSKRPKTGFVAVEKKGRSKGGSWWQQDKL